MKPRTLLAVVALALFLAVPGAFSPAVEPPQRPDQPAPLPGAASPVKTLENARNALDKMNLSDQEKTKAAEILDKAIAQAKDLQQKSEALQRDVRQQLSEVLDPDQFKELAQKMGPGRRGGAANPGAPGGGAMPLLQAFQQALPQLDLTPDQQQQLKDLRQDFQQRIKAIRDQSANGQDVRDQMQQLRDD